MKGCFANLAMVGVIFSMGCSDAPTLSEAPSRLQPTVPSRNTTYDPSTQTLGATLNAVSHVSVSGESATWIPLKVGATSAPGDTLIWYDWFESYCYWDSTVCSPLANFRGGWGLDSILVEYPGSMSEIHFVAHIRDAADTTGGSAYRTIVNLSNPAVDAQSFSCDLGDTYYPLIDFDSTHYRRNGCTGAREYNPNGT